MPAKLIRFPTDLDKETFSALIELACQRAEEEWRLKEEEKEPPVEDLCLNFGGEM